MEWHGSKSSTGRYSVFPIIASYLTESFIFDVQFVQWAFKDESFVIKKLLDETLSASYFRKPYYSFCYSVLKFVWLKSIPVISHYSIPKKTIQKIYIYMYVELWILDAFWIKFSHFFSVFSAPLPPIT